MVFLREVFLMRMDTTAEIKRDLISRIEKSNDIEFLQALKVIIDASAEKAYQLNSKQQKAIDTGREQIKKGEFIDNEVLIMEMKEWLAKK